MIHLRSFLSALLRTGDSIPNARPLLMVFLMHVAMVTGIILEGLCFDLVELFFDVTSDPAVSYATCMRVFDVQFCRL